MKRLLAVGCLLSILGSVTYAEDAKFSAAVSADDYAAAGLNTLTSAQLQRLDALVENYKSGALAAARKAAEEAEAQKRVVEAEAARAAAEAQVTLAAAKAEAEKAQLAKAAAEKHAAAAEAGRKEAEKTAQSSLFVKARDIFKSDPKKNEPLVETTIRGKFQGWNPHQVFTLANGQRWQVANNDSYYTRARENVKIQILPAVMFGYWMRFPDLDTQVRVNFVSE